MQEQRKMFTFIFYFLCPLYIYYFFSYSRWMRHGCAKKSLMSNHAAVLLINLFIRIPRAFVKWLLAKGILCSNTSLTTEDFVSGSCCPNTAQKNFCLSPVLSCMSKSFENKHIAEGATNREINSSCASGKSCIQKAFAKRG